MTEVITHIVLFKYKPSITWSEFEQHFDVFMALKNKCIKQGTGKPYMLSMKAGAIPFAGSKEVYESNAKH
jgi:hypothetical protein